MSLGVVFAVQLYKRSIVSSSVPVDCHVAIKSYLAVCGSLGEHTTIYAKLLL